jgi:hypothetical protein
MATFILPLWEHPILHSNDLVNTLKLDLQDRKKFIILLTIVNILIKSEAPLLMYIMAICIIFVVAYSRCYSSICQQGMKNIPRKSFVTCQYASLVSNRVPPEYNSRVLQLKIDETAYECADWMLTTRGNKQGVYNCALFFLAAYRTFIHQIHTESVKAS